MTMTRRLNRFAWGFGLVLGLLAGGQTASAGEYVLTEYGGVGDGQFNNAPVINAIIRNLPPEGGTIVVPEGEFRINSPIVLNKSFVTIRGNNHGQRSNVDPAVPGTTGPAGGSKILVGPGVEAGILVPNEQPRISGLLIRDLAIQGLDPGTNQGIVIDRASDGVRIENVNCINLDKGIFMRDADAARISGCWLAECRAPLHIDAGRQIIVADNHLGGQPGGVTAGFNNLDHLQFTGNTIFPDGNVGLSLGNCHQCNISDNTISGLYTGLIEINGNMNTLSNNGIFAERRNGQWAPDPAGRDGLWGLIRIEGNDNMVSSNNIISWQPENDTRLHIVGGERNQVYNNNIAGIGSSRMIVVNGANAIGTRIINSGYPNEIREGNDSTGVRYSP
jgi:hypothetical protein